jgi:hypothetical protein
MDSELQAKTAHELGEALKLGYFEFHRGGLLETGAFRQLVSRLPSAQHIPLIVLATSDALMRFMTKDCMGHEDSARIDIAQCGLPECCNSSGAPLKKCTRCKMVAYCGKVHQAKDWEQHKPVCRALRNADAERAEVVRQFWQTVEVQQKNHRILQGGVKWSDQVAQTSMQSVRAGMKRSHASTVARVLALEASPERNWKSSTSDSNAGMACSIPIAQLRSIKVVDLRSGEVHAGDVLWVQIIGDFYKIQGATTIACDRSGACCILSLYNFFADDATSLTCKRKLPVGTVLAIKEPYFKLSNNGDLILRVDAPSNVKVHTGWDDSVRLTTVCSAFEFKQVGNKAHTQGNFEAACTAYTEALACTHAPDSELEVVLYSNRAQSFLSRAMFFEAKSDANAALAIDTTHTKSKHRLAFALDGLGRHNEALKLMETYRCPKADIEHVQMRLQQSRGYYQLPQNLRECSPPDSFLAKFADLRAAGSKGRGLFLTQSVALGEPLFVERAFAATKRSTTTTTTTTSQFVDYTLSAGGRINDSAQEEIIGIAVRRAGSRCIDNERLAFLYGGPRGDTIPDMSILKLQCESPSVGADQCSVSQIRQIVRYNVFAIDQAYGRGELEGGCGLWVLASFMNHADPQECTAKREFIGPMMFVFANRDLPANTELTTSYRDAGTENWGFKKDN